MDVLLVLVLSFSLYIHKIVANYINVSETFYYFAYGSNMLSSRMHVNCETAVLHSIAELKGWRLDFNSLPKQGRWNGAVATIVEDEENTVWGSLWVISMADSEKLDKQEGVHTGWYKRTTLPVLLPSQQVIKARAYVMTNAPAKNDPENLPLARRPSRTYLQVILLGAIESKIPVVHLEFINRFPHNGKIAPNATRKALGYPFYDDSFQ